MGCPRGELRGEDEDAEDQARHERGKIEASLKGREAPGEIQPEEQRIGHERRDEGCLEAAVAAGLLARAEEQGQDRPAEDEGHEHPVVDPQPLGEGLEEGGAEPACHPAGHLERVLQEEELQAEGRADQAPHHEGEHSSHPQVSVTAEPRPPHAGREMVGEENPHERGEGKGICGARGRTRRPRRQEGASPSFEPRRAEEKSQAQGHVREGRSVGAPEGQRGEKQRVSD